MAESRVPYRCVHNGGGGMRAGEFGMDAAAGWQAARCPGLFVVAKQPESATEGTRNVSHHVPISLSLLSR